MKSPMAKSISLCLYSFPLKYPLPFNAPMSMGASPESKEVKMCLLLKYCARVFPHLLVRVDRCCVQPKVLLKCSWSLIHQSGYKYAVWNWSASLLFILSFLLFPRHWSLAQKVCVLNFHSSIFVRSDTCRVASGSEKALAQSTPSFKAISCCIPGEPEVYQILYNKLASR